MDVRHVQGPGFGVQQADGDQDEGRSDRSQHQIVEGCGQRLFGALSSHGDEAVDGQRRDLQQHIDVKRISGDEDAEQAGDGEEPQRPEEAPAIGWDLVVHSLA